MIGIVLYRTEGEGKDIHMAIINFLANPGCVAAKLWS